MLEGAVEAGEDEIDVVEERLAALVEIQIGVQRDEEAVRFGEGDDLAEIVADQRLAAGEAEAHDAHALQLAEQQLDVRQGEMTRIEERRVAVAAAQVAAVGDRERG